MEASAYILTHFYKCKPQPYSIVQNILFLRITEQKYSVLCLLFFPEKQTKIGPQIVLFFFEIWGQIASIFWILVGTYKIEPRASPVDYGLKRKGVWLEAPFSLPWDPLSPTPPGKDPILLQEPKDLFHVQWSLTCHKVYHSCLSYTLHPSKKLWLAQ